MKVHLNNKENEIRSELELSDFLDKIDSNRNVEAWIMSPNSQSLCLLKSGNNTFLMYLRYPEDEGFVSDSKLEISDTEEFILGNGQVDEFPLSWCIDKEWAYKAFAYFYVNEGEQSPHINWQVS
jgi:hypothetical protein